MDEKSGIQIKSEIDTDDASPPESPPALQIYDELEIVKPEIDEVHYKLFKDQSNEGILKSDPDCLTPAYESFDAEEFDSKDNLNPQEPFVSEDQTEPSSFACDTCKNVFPSEADLDVHVLIHSDLNRFTCPKCNETFADEASLNMHTSEHTELPICPRKIKAVKGTREKPYKCEVCDARFTAEPILRKHMLIHTGKKRFVCNILNVKLSLLHKMVDHANTPTNKGPNKGDCSNGSVTAEPFSNFESRDIRKMFKCKVCNKGTIGESRFKEHILSHTVDKPYKCDICHSGFTSLKGIRSHVFIHNKKKPYQCNLCAYICKSKQRLTQHVRNHTAEELFECDMCGYKCQTKDLLKLHARNHSREYPLQCKACNKAFATKYALQFHIRGHTGENLFECAICSKRFVNKDSLNMHCKLHTGEKPFQCQICNKRFLRKSGLNSHRKCIPLNNLSNFG